MQSGNKNFDDPRDAFRRLHSQRNKHKSLYSFNVEVNLPQLHFIADKMCWNIVFGNKLFVEQNKCYVQHE